MTLAENGSISNLPYPLTTENIVAFVEQAADALQYMHGRGYIHRDIKPENLLLQANNMLLVGDLELCARGTNERPYEGTDLGDLLYKAPEQWEEIATPQSDQYALGICVYQWLTGEHPFRIPTASPHVIRDAHLHKLPPDIEQKLKRLITDQAEIKGRTAMGKIVSKAIAKNRAERFSDMQTFASELRRSYENSLPNRRTFTS